MSDASRPLFYVHNLADSDRQAYLEQLIFARSPLNIWLTALVLYGVLLLPFVAATAVTGVPWIVTAAGTSVLEPRVRTALSLALIAAAALALQRYGRIKECEEAPALACALRPEVAAQVLAFPARRLRVASAIGVALGVLIAALGFTRPPEAAQATNAPMVVWFSAMTVLLFVLFARGVELTRSGSQGTAKVVREGLVVDLLQIEQLYPWGRASARLALLWFSVSAACCLLLVSQGITAFTIGVTGACALMGAWVFFSNMDLVHRKIRETKTAELADLRAAIAVARRDMERDPASAPRLQGLLAYEARIASVHEWPFDQHILVRFGASALMLAVPWFGQAAAAAVVERLGQVLH